MRFGRFGLALLALLVGCTLAHRNQECRDVYGGEDVTAIIVADPGDFAETGEIKYLLDNLRHRRGIDMAGSMCAKAYRGKLLGQQVALMISGIGPTAAALCVYDLLSCAEVIKDVVYMGTSGWSPQQGGLLNPEDCSTPNHGAQLTRIGDVCITPFAVNWVCKKADWAAQCGSYPNLCGRPGEQFGPQVTSLYGKCMFTRPGQGSFQLADELLAAARTAAKEGLMPRRDEVLQTWESNYWAAMSRNTGLNVTLDPDYIPQAWDYNSCVEVDSQFFFSGVPWELTARDYTAITINLALNTTYTAKDVIAVSAMEGIGLAEVMSRHNDLKTTTRPIPWAIVRGNADWLHNVVGQESPGVWVYQDPVLDDFNSTYKYSIATASTVVLTMMRARCRERRVQGQGHGSRKVLEGRGRHHSKECDFVVDYNSEGGRGADVKREIEVVDYSSERQREEERGRGIEIEREMEKNFAWRTHPTL